MILNLFKKSKNVQVFPEKSKFKISQEIWLSPVIHATWEARAVG
jgi:hypothetical protein